MYELIITNKNYSSWSMRAWVLMRQLGIPFTERLLPLPPRAHSRALRPSGNVPCLVDGDCWSGTRCAIAEYLAERHAGVWPEDARARAWARSAAAEMHSGFSALRNECSMSVGVRIRRHGISDALQADLARLAELWADGFARHGGPFLAGAKFTAVDAFFVPVASRVQTYGLPLPAQAADYVGPTAGSAGREGMDRRGHRREFPRRQCMRRKSCRRACCWRICVHRPGNAMQRLSTAGALCCRLRCCWCCSRPAIRGRCNRKACRRQWWKCRHRRAARTRPPTGTTCRAGAPMTLARPGRRCWPAASHRAWHRRGARSAARAQAIAATDVTAQRALIESRLRPWRITTMSQDGSNERSDQGIVTGYYEPVVNGSRKRGGAYQTPLYARAG